MSQATTLRSRIQRIATLIESDVRRRGLTAGDAYLTAVQASKEFGVDTLTANRAMALLAKQGTLIRKQGIGTFIGDRIDMAHSTSTTPALKYIQIIQQRSTPGDTRWVFPVGQLVQALHDVLPLHQIQSTTLPQENSLAIVRQLIESHKDDGSLSGILLTGCSREIQQLACDYHIPTTVFGKLYPTTTALCSIDFDQVEAGRLLAKRLMDAGHRRVLVLMRENWRPGDNQFLEGIHQGMADAGATMNSIITRSIAGEAIAVENEIDRLLEMDDRPTGLICRCARMVEIAQESLKSRGIRVPEDLDIVFNNYDSTIADELRAPCSASEISASEQAKLVAQLLERQLSGSQEEPEHITLPVKLFEPKS